MSDNPLETFAGDVKPSPTLKRRVEQTLRQRGHLPAAFTSWRPIGLAASLLAAAGLGFGAGRISLPGASPGSREYLLLLREDSTYHDDREVAEIVGEYARWADSLRRNDLLVLAEKLGDEEESVVASSVPVFEAEESATTGFFLVRAPDLETARSIAASSPHLKYGGRIVIRSIQ
jgi:hypothetical protein